MQIETQIKFFDGKLYKVTIEQVESVSVEYSAEAPVEAPKVEEAAPAAPEVQEVAEVVEAVGEQPQTPAPAADEQSVTV